MGPNIIFFFLLGGCKSCQPCSSCLIVLVNCCVVWLAMEQIKIDRHVNLFVSLYSTGQLSAVEYLTVCNCTVTVTVTVTVSARSSDNTPI